MAAFADLAQEEFGYLSTAGRRTGRLHTVEMWFALVPEPRTVYMLSGGGAESDWVKNIRQDSNVTFRIAETLLPGQARVVQDPAEDRRARAMLVKKYYGRDELQTEGWEATALPIAVDIAL